MLKKFFLIAYSYCKRPLTNFRNSKPQQGGFWRQTMRPITDACRSIAKRSHHNCFATVTFWTTAFCTPSRSNLGCLLRRPSLLSYSRSWPRRLINRQRSWLTFDKSVRMLELTSRKFQDHVKPGIYIVLEVVYKF